MRLLALTLLAYVPRPDAVHHPRAMETVFQSLSSVYDARVMIASHSPVGSGATSIVRGIAHPRLKDWRGDVNLGMLYAGGVPG